MRYLIILLVVVVGVLLWRRIGRTAAPTDIAERPMASMVQCHVCGVYLPQSEALRSDDHYYCTAEHQDRDAAQ